MAEMIDVELNLKVARIMYPEYKWHSLDGMDIAQGTSKTLPKKHFIYSNQSCAFDMAVWLAINATLATQKNAVFQLAAAIKKTGESDE